MVTEGTPLNQSTIVLDPYRWVILLIFSTYCATNFFLVYEFAIIANVVESYYNIGSLAADASGLVFMIAYIIFAIPVGRFIEQHDLWVVSVVSTGLTAFGNLLKFLALSPDRFYFIVISQSICGFAQVFMLGLPPKVACVWFGATEVSKACGVGMMGIMLGMALGSSIPTYLVPDTVIRGEIYNGFFKLFALNNASSLLMFVIVLMFFRSRPEHPPSLSQANILQAQENHNSIEKTDLKKYFMNKDFLLILYCFGMEWGMWNAIGFVLNETFIKGFPNIGNIEGDLQMLGLLLGGVLGSLIFGYILDRTHEFKKLSVFLLTMNCLSWMFFVYFFEMKSLAGACTFFLVAGFFGGSLAVTGFEYATEVLFPLPEAYGTTILSCSVYSFTILLTVLMEYVYSRIGLLAGQLIQVIFFGTAAVGSIFISSNFKRRDANIDNSIHEENGIMK